MKYIEKTGEYLAWAMLCLLLIFHTATQLAAKEEKEISVKETGVYIMTDQGVTRLLPNIVYNGKGVPFIEINNPPHFPIKDFQTIILSGKYDLRVLTVNPMLYLEASPLGRQRFFFGKDIAIEVKPKGAGLQVVKLKGLIGRGYYSLWINENAWDFVLD